MEKDSLRSNNNGSTSNTTTHSTAQRTSLDPNGQTTSSDFVLQWGNRKRLRCMKVQVKDVSTALVHKTTVRVDRRVVRADNIDTSDHQPRSTNNSSSNNNNPINHSNGYFNLRQRPPTLPPPPPPPPPPQRSLRLLFLGKFGAFVVFGGIMGWTGVVEWSSIHRRTCAC